MGLRLVDLLAAVVGYGAAAALGWKIGVITLDQLLAAVIGFIAGALLTLSAVRAALRRTTPARDAQPVDRTLDALSEEQAAPTPIADDPTAAIGTCHDRTCPRRWRHPCHAAGCEAHGLAEA